ncbi:MAG: bifunctional phosphoribosylaminoimidazolecarboxamide formyltransferase/IMP cyclohydrolase [Ignavibacteriales bacterium]|nr:bifunctional phosphoribosylaminoimidazolecarboxamide formyltransferase/IMP cyclohydrolase [Ignavibacteriales bacterium]
MKKAVISVSDKTGVEKLAKALAEKDYQIVATGRTANMIAEAGVGVVPVSDLTGFPEIFGGRVKTLHPKIFGGILMRHDDAGDREEAERAGVEPIDVVCVNLYPFEKTVANPNATTEDAIENIDVGGPSLIRAAAKNHKRVTVLTDPSQYDEFIEKLGADRLDEKTRKRLATAAFAHTAKYDVAIANELERRFEIERTEARLVLPKVADMRYGENPHQSAAIYGSFDDYFEPLHGKALSYNNILDVAAAAELVDEMPERSCAIIKHNNPAGAATGADAYDAYAKALSCDPVSSFGGVVVVNEPVDEKLARKLNEIFLEAIAAPAFEESALEVLKKKKNRRLLKRIRSLNEPGLRYKSAPGGLLEQSADWIDADFDDLRVATKRAPTPEESADLRFAWIVCKHVKSNAILFAKNRQTVGVGAGQVSRVDSAKIATMKAREFGFDLTGAVAASDAFFPFPDGLIEIAEAGVKAIIQPGGSVRDEEVIAAADERGVAMVFTGVRHFKH